MRKKTIGWIGVVCLLLTGAILFGSVYLSTHRGPFSHFSSLHPNLTNRDITIVGIREIEGFLIGPKSVEEAANYVKNIGFECVIRNRKNAPEYFEARNTSVTHTDMSMPVLNGPARLKISENHYCEYRFGPLLGTGQRWVLSFDIDFNRRVSGAKSYLLCDFCP